MVKKLWMAGMVIFIPRSVQIIIALGLNFILATKLKVTGILRGKTLYQLPVNLFKNRRNPST